MPLFRKPPNVEYPETLQCPFCHMQVKRHCYRQVKTGDKITVKQNRRCNWYACYQHKQVVVTYLTDLHRKEDGTWAWHQAYRTFRRGQFT